MTRRIIVVHRRGRYRAIGLLVFLGLGVLGFAYSHPLIAAAVVGVAVSAFLWRRDHQ